MGPLEYLAQELESFGCAPSPADWRRICDHAFERRFHSRAPIYEASKIADRWIIISSGIASSYYTHFDGRVTLTRFFEPGHIAGNVTSTWTKDYGSDELLAITDVEGVEFPHEFLLQEYMHTQAFGAFVRLKVVQTLQFDKDLLVCQSLNDPDARLAFLEKQHVAVLQHALKKDIAAFLGVTPQGYSRILRRRRGD